MHVCPRPFAGVPFFHCTAAVLALFVSAAQAQTPAANPAPATGEASFTVFRGGTEIGRVQTNVSRAGTDWLITSTGRVGDLIINRFEKSQARKIGAKEIRDALGRDVSYHVSNDFSLMRAAIDRGVAIDELKRTGDPRLVDDGRFFETPPMSGPVTARPPATKEARRR